MNYRSITSIFVGVFHSRGLSMETVFANIMRAYSDPNFLVLVLGTTDQEEKFFIDKLQSLGVEHLPRVITAQCLSDERSVYI